jgi:chemotaxis protein MotB
MRIFGFLIGGVCVLNLFSCSTSSEFGTKFDKFFQSKRYRVTILERDSLIAVNRLLQTDTIRMGGHIRSLQNEYKKLSDDYLSLATKDSVLNKDYAELKNQQIKAREYYRQYSDSLEKKLSLMTEELRVKSAQIASNDSILNSGRPSPQDLAMMAKRDSMVKELDNTVKNALTGYNPSELSTEMRDGKLCVSVSDNLLFKTGTSTVADNGRKVLKKLSRVINQYPDLNVAIEGVANTKTVDQASARTKAITGILSEEYDVNPTKLTSSVKGEFLRASDKVDTRAKIRGTAFILSPGQEDLSKEKK